MKKVFFILLVLVGLHAAAQTGKTILVVLAHPDDETAMGAVLHTLSRENSVILVTATDGRYGVRAHAGNISGDTLAAVRKKELECSCKVLGIDSLIHLQYPNGLGGRTSVGEYFTQTRQLKEDIRAIIENLHPSFIITFGPDGDTGHSDHRNIGNLVTEVLLREAWVDLYPLYYLAWTKALSNQMGGLGYMADD